jgi:hypothetical protein
MKLLQKRKKGGQPAAGALSSGCSSPLLRACWGGGDRLLEPLARLERGDGLVRAAKRVEVLDLVDADLNGSTQAVISRRKALREI